MIRLLKEKPVLGSRTMWRRRPELAHHDVAVGIIFKTVKWPGMRTSGLRLDAHSPPVGVLGEKSVVLLSHQMGDSLSEVREESVGCGQVIHDKTSQNREIRDDVVAIVVEEVTLETVRPIHSPALPTVGLHVFQGLSHVGSGGVQNRINNSIPVIIKSFRAHIVQHVPLPRIAGSRDGRIGACETDS